MKTKLLKRLKREAKMRYRIKRINGEYWLYVRTYISIFNYCCYDYFYRPSASYKRLKDAQNVCNYNRRKYILDEVERLRNEQEKFINF